MNVMTKTMTSTNNNDEYKQFNSQSSSATQKESKVPSEVKREMAPIRLDASPTVSYADWKVYLWEEYVSGS
jgi:hypothetical protein